jgi:hypothetical protein
VEGDTAKLSDGYYAVRALTQHLDKISNVQGSFLNLLLDESLPLPTQQHSHSFTQTFQQTWQPRAQQAQTDTEAILDPREDVGPITPPSALKASFPFPFSPFGF